MDYKQLKQMFSQHESSYPKIHLTACITFASSDPEDGEKYPWNSWNGRTYAVSSDNDAFQPDKGGYSIYGSSLNRSSGPQTRLDPYISDEYDRKGGLVVEDCCIVGYLLIECSDCNISPPKLFYTRSDALECMLSRLAETGELDAEQIKKDFAAAKELFEEGHYGAKQDSAWMADSSEDWHWKLQPVFIYGPTKIVIPETEDTSWPM